MLVSLSFIFLVLFLRYQFFSLDLHNTLEEKINICHQTMLNNYTNYDNSTKTKEMLDRYANFVLLII